jgi:2-isopropylmalate synthase
LVDVEVNLQLYSVSNVTHGTDALGEVNVRLESDGRIVNGQGADTDIIDTFNIGFFKSNSTQHFK